MGGGDSLVADLTDEGAIPALGNDAYVAAKHGLEGLATVIALEGGQWAAR